MNPGDLLLDERIARGRGGGTGARAGTSVAMRSRYASGAAPVLIRVLPNRRARSRAPTPTATAPRRPGSAWRRCSTNPAHSTATRSPRACARSPRENIYIGGSSWKYEGWLGQVYSRARYLTRGKFSKRVFETKCLREYAETFPTVCGDFSFYQFPTEDYWRKLFALVPEGFRFAFKVPEQITCKVFPTHARYGAAGGPGERELSRRGDAEARCSCARSSRYRAQDRAADLRIRHVFAARVRGAGRVSRAARPVPRRAAAGVPLRRGDPQPGVPGARLFPLPARARRGARLQRVVAHAGAWPADGHPGFDDGGFRGVPRAAAARARVRGRGGDVRALHGDQGPQSGGARIACGC